jgi:hypothetical protein
VIYKSIASTGSGIWMVIFFVFNFSSRIKAAPCLSPLDRLVTVMDGQTRPSVISNKALVHPLRKYLSIFKHIRAYSREYSKNLSITSDS